MTPESLFPVWSHHLPPGRAARWPAAETARAVENVRVPNRPSRGDLAPAGAAPLPRNFSACEALHSPPTEAARTLILTVPLHLGVAQWPLSLTNLDASTVRIRRTSPAFYWHSACSAFSRASASFS